MDPAVQAPLVEDLPRLGLDGLTGVDPPDLDALAKPADDPVCAGGVEDVGEIVRPLPLQVVQVAAAGHNLVLTAHLPQFPLRHLLGVDRHWVVQARLPALRRKITPFHAKGRGPWPRPNSCLLVLTSPGFPEPN